ncbi:interleukin-17F-like [Biomphalaria glabrata]|uniref:Interleukin-17F-like n=1 Tax=Biomphalaria glabrata TaxID=6526 RepID=A0A9W2YK76_BIOGL|nr:interleukin-17F-like [Biomphalaria glabrata]
MEETFFIPQELRYLYKDLTITDRSSDVYTDWIKESEVHTNSGLLSTCPWKYRMVWNPDRIPSSHVEAVCLTAQCLKGKTDVYQDSYHVDSDCSKIEYARWVKVKTRTADGRDKFRKRILMVNVGCTCKPENVIKLN